MTGPEATAAIAELEKTEIQAGGMPSDAEFAVFYETHYRRACSWARGMGVPAGDVEDRVAEAFARAWKGFGSFRREAAFGTWFHRILRNTVYALGRPSHDEFIEDAHEARGSGPESRVESREIALRIDEAVGRLSPTERQVFVMKELEEMRHATISRKLGMAEATSRIHYFRALRKLREELHDLVG